MNRTTTEWPFPGPVLTVNPIFGCQRVSEGCANCYAEAKARQEARCGAPHYVDVITGGLWNGRTVFLPSVVDEVMTRRRPASMIWCGMSDLFHMENASVLDYIFATIVATPHLTHVVLTKRPERMAEYFATRPQLCDRTNLWLGVTAENQRWAEGRIPSLLRLEGKCRRFVSVEPILGPVDMRRFLAQGAIDLVMCGTETGANARQARLEWLRFLRDQCAVAGVPFFLRRVNRSGERMLDGKEYRPQVGREPGRHESDAAASLFDAGGKGR